MGPRFSRSIAAIFAIPVLTACSSSAEESYRAELGEGVADAMRDGHPPTSILVHLKGSADLAPSAALTDKEERGAFVWGRLREHAKGAQAPLLGWLASEGARTKPFFIVNAVLVDDAKPALIRALANRAEVRRLSIDKPVVRKAERRAVIAPHVAAVETSIEATGAPRVWSELGFDGRGVVIGVQDSGVQWDHPALRSQYRGWNGTSADHRISWHDAIQSGATKNPCGYNLSAPCDDLGHGTHTAGTMLGDDGLGNRIGMAPGAKWIACRSMNEDVGRPSTYIECSEWFLAPYPQDATAEQGDPSKAPDVIGNSWVCLPAEGCSGDELVPVVHALTAAGIVFVAAAGNAGPECGTIRDQPGSIAEALTVGSYDHRTGEIDPASGRGPSALGGAIAPDVVAPGIEIRSALPSNLGFEGYGPSTGTSMAAPHVVGEIALLLSAVPRLRGDVAALTDAVVRTATPKTSAESCGGVRGDAIPNPTWGHGVIDAYKAVSSELSKP